MTPPTTRRSVAFVLASWRPDAPAGMERATAALATGLTQAGHHAVIVTAAPQPHQPGLPGVQVEALTCLRVTFPCDDLTLREAITRDEHVIAGQLARILTRHRADTVVFVDALWGLGRLHAELPARRVLAVHVLGHDADLRPALARADVVIAPSPVVLAQAAEAGWNTTDWRIVPNALLHDPETGPQPPHAVREELRRAGPVRVLARLGPEKGVAELLAAARDWDRPLEMALAKADFEAEHGAQQTLLRRCQQLAEASKSARVRDGLPWRAVPGWLAGAAVVIVPSLAETFGLVAAEALGVGTPVVAYRLGHLPALIGEGDDGAGGVLVEPGEGPAGLLRAAEALLVDSLRYGAISRAAYYRSRDFRPLRVAECFVEAVS